MSDHIVETPVRERVPIYTDTPSAGLKQVVVSGGVFDREHDLPSTDDTITVVHGDRAFRGVVREIVFLVEVKTN